MAKLTLGDPMLVGDRADPKKRGRAVSRSWAAGRTDDPDSDMRTQGKPGRWRISRNGGGTWEDNYETPDEALAAFKPRSRDRREEQAAAPPLRPYAGCSVRCGCSVRSVAAAVAASSQPFQPRPRDRLVTQPDHHGAYQATAAAGSIR